MSDPLDDTTIARTPGEPAGTSPEPDAAPAADAQTSATDTPPQYGVGPFSIREVALAGVWLVAFILSFLPLNAVFGNGRALFGGANVWVSGLSWILAIGLPTVAVFLIVLRRLSPQGIRRVGSLGIDQFASVAFSVAAIVWLTWLWDTIAIVIEAGVWTRSWVVWVEAILMLAGVVLTVFAPIIPVLEQDFQDRPASPAHRNARAVRPVSPRPARPPRERPAPAPAAGPAAAAGSYEPGPGAYEPGAGAYAAPSGPSEAPTTAYEAPPAASDAPAGTDGSATGAYESPVGAYDEPVIVEEPRVDATSQANAPARASTDDQETDAFDADVFAVLTGDARTDDEPAAAQPEPVRHQAFWALAPVERDVVDEYGRPLFRIGPTAWALVIEDRGDVFVMRHEDGRIGYLHDVTGITRG